MPRFRIHDKSQNTVVESLFPSLRASGHVGQYINIRVPPDINMRLMPDRTNRRANGTSECVIRECEPEYIRTVPYRIQYGHAPYRSIMRLMACWCADSQLGPRGLVVAPKAKKKNSSWHDEPMMKAPGLP
jgi:hypothetical protein